MNKDPNIIQVVELHFTGKFFTIYQFYYVGINNCKKTNSRLPVPCVDFYKWNGNNISICNKNV